MLEIRLYKNCRFNNKYQEVMTLDALDSAPTSVFEYYLNSLEFYNFTSELTYYENSGELIFERDYNFKIYDYNYMRVYEKDELNRIILTRFCFVNKIECKNGCVYLSYEEDIWHSYYREIKGIQTSYLERSRVCNYLNFIPSIKELNKEYDGNNNLILTSLSYPNFPNIIRMYMLVEIQLYDLVSATEEKDNREILYAIIRYSSQSYASTFGQLETNCRILMENMATQKIRNHNYEIGNVYAIPQDLLNESNDFSTSEETLFSSLYMKVGLSSAYSVVKTGNIINNYKNIFLGTYDNNIKLINNGTTIDYTIVYSMCSAGISLKLNCMNQILDLTNSFKYEIPFQSLLSQEYAQRKISYELEKNNLEANKNLRASDEVYSFISGIQNLAKLNIAGGAKGIFDTFYNNPFGKWAKEGAKEEFINAPKYSNSKGNISNLNNICNILYGLVIGKIEPDNNYFVKNCVDNFGFKVYEFVDYEKFNAIFNRSYIVSRNANYDYVKFSTINVYGSFPNDIADKLNEILSTGIKIWYMPTFDDDNYTDDLL